MKLNEMSLNQKLGLLAIFLGIIALFTKDPAKTSFVKVDPKKLLLETKSTTKFLTPFELAEKIIKGTESFLLVDLRSPNEYEKGTIPNAINLTVQDLFDNTLGRNQQIILFSDDDTKSLNAWIALVAMDYKNVYVLKDGFNGWINEVLYPKLPLDLNGRDKTKSEKIIQVSNYFGGSPIFLSEGKTIQTERMEFKQPPTQLPKQSVAMPKPGSTKKPKREGC
ncbi:MAG: rhodanese-like domain-containing protein [Candidatus Kapaibacteriota bacterium]